MFASSAYRAPMQPAGGAAAAGGGAGGVARALGRATLSEPAAPLLVPAKRKWQPQDSEGRDNRDHSFISSLKLRFVRRAQQLADLEGVSSGHLLRSGDLLLRHVGGISLLHEASEAPEPNHQVLTRKSYAQLEVSPSSCGMNTLGDGWRELVVAGGDVLLAATLDRDGHGAVSVRDLSLASAHQDRVTRVYHGGDSYILGTASGALYVLAQDDADSVPGPRTRLTRQQSLLSAVVGTGAQFLGGLLFGASAAAPEAGDASGDLAVVAVCSLPVGARDLLLVASRSRLAVWADFTSPTRASELLDIMLRELLAHDLSRQYNLFLEGEEGGRAHTYHTSDVHVEALDMVLLPRNVHNGSTNSDHCSVALLCSSYCYSEPSVCALWVYVLELPIGVDGTDAALKHDPFIANRLIVGNNIPKSVLSDPAFRPSVHYVRFVDHTATLPVAVAWASADGLLQVSLCEIAVLALSSAAHEAVPLPMCPVPDSLRPIAVADVLSVAPASGLLVEEGLFVVLKDGSIFCTRASEEGDADTGREASLLSREDGEADGLAPPSLLLRSSPLEVDSARGAQLMLRAAKEFAFIEDFGSPQKRWARGTGSSSSAASTMRTGVGVAPMSSACRAALADLRQYLDSASSAAVLEAVRRASSSICSKLPVGQSWGESGSASGGGLGTGGGAYVLITTMLREKRALHEKLVRVLQNTRTWGSVPGVRRALRVDHGLLLAASGLCAALLECEAKQQQAQPQKQIGTADRPTQEESDFLTSGHAALLEVCRGGIRAFAARWLEQQQSLPEADLAALGLRPVDAFFAATLQVPRGMLSIAQELEAQSERLRREHRALPCAFALGSMLLAALEGTTEAAGQGQGGGEDVIAADVSGFRDVREALKTVLQVILRDLTASASSHSRPQRLVRPGPTLDSAMGAVASIRSTASDAGSVQQQASPITIGLSEFLPASSWGTAEEYVQRVGWRREVEGNRLVHMCSTLLKGYEGASQDGDAAGADFEDAKAVCVGALLAVGQARDAFALSTAFTYLPGLVACADREPAALFPALALEVRRRSETRGLADGSSSLGLFVLCDLEERGYFSKALEFAEYVTPAILKDFLETRPVFASVYMRQGDGLSSAAALGTSAAASLQAAQRESGAASAAALLSLGKLSAALAMRDAAEGVGSDASLLEVLDSSAQVFSNTTTGLAIIRAQDIAIQCGAMTASVEDEGGAVIRCSGTAILTALLSHTRQLLDAALSKGFGAPARGDSDLDSSLDALGVSEGDLVQYLGAALAVLSELERDVRRREEAEGSNGSTASMRGAVQGMLIDLWAAAMETDAPLWVRLSDSGGGRALIEGPDTEASLRGTVLAQLCGAVAEDVASDVSGAAATSEGRGALAVVPLPGSPLLKSSVTLLHQRLNCPERGGRCDVNVLYNLAEACVGYIFRS